jgi:hypothetical protein
MTPTIVPVRVRESKSVTQGLPLVRHGWDGQSSPCSRRTRAPPPRTGERESVRG